MQDPQIELRRAALAGELGPEVKERYRAAQIAQATDRDEVVQGATYQSVKNYLNKWCSSYTRITELMSLRQGMKPIEWWRLLGDSWPSCDNIADHKETLRDLINSAEDRHLAAMMTPYERRRLKSLQPGPITVYRGCYECNADGLSWSLSKSVAAKFPTYNRYKRRDDNPLLIEGVVLANRAIVKTARKEQEVICSRVDVVSIIDLRNG